MRRLVLLVWAVLSLLAATVVAPAPAPATATEPTASSARAATIRLDSRTLLVVPTGAMPPGAFILVDRLGDARAKRNKGLLSKPVKLRLKGARRLRKPARVEYQLPRADPGPVRIATWNARRGKWIPRATRVDRARGVAWANVRSFGSGRQRGRAGAAIDVDFALGVIAEWGQFWGEILNKRAARPNCPTQPPDWVEGVTFANDATLPAFSCGMRDPHNAAVAEVRIVNNRSYGMWLSFPRHQPDWAWLDMGGWFWGDLKRLAAGRLSFGPHENDIFLPPGTEVHLGFSERGRDDIPVQVSPARDMIAISAAISILSNKVFGLRRARAVMAPLFVCPNNAQQVASGDLGWNFRSARDVASAGIECARKSIDAIAARKMAFLDTATHDYLALRKAALVGYSRALSVIDLAYAGQEFFEWSVLNPQTAVTVKHSAVPDRRDPAAPVPVAANLTATDVGGGQVDVAFDVGWSAGRDPVTCRIFQDGVEVFTAQCGTRASKRLTGVPSGVRRFHATVTDRFGVASPPSNTVTLNVAGSPPPPATPKPSAWNLQVVVYGGGHVGMSFNVGWDAGRDPVTCHFFRDNVEVFTAQCGTFSSKQFYNVPAGRHSFHATVSDRFGVYSDPTPVIVRDTT